MSEIKWDSIVVIHPHKDWRFWRNCLFLVFWGRGAAVQAYFIVLCRYCPSLFYILKVCGHPALSKSIGTVFVTAFAHFMSVCQFGNSCNISDFCYPKPGYILFWALFQDGSICCHPWFGRFLAKKLSKFNNSTECSC